VLLTGIAPNREIELSPTAVEPDAWDRLAGMGELKRLIERRVLLPIRERPRAERHGVAPPGAILLFGPPGTGKTALARAVAGRLGWAFLDVDVSLIALDPGGLRWFFTRLRELDQAIVFFDEFEQLGLKRDGHATSAELLTAELLRVLPGPRGAGGVLVVCATNCVRLVDPALLRPGRFGLVLPVGPPEAADRAAVLRRLLMGRPCGRLDLGAVAQRSAGRTPSDLEAVCGRAAQAAFEREVHGGLRSRIETADLLLALERCRPTLGPDDVQAFEEDVARFARA
jgi:SpoVK/Ycf46/Vps4 family AAA+-type ATPase